MSETTIGRLRAKLAQRDRRIAGLQRRIQQLEHKLAMAHIERDTLPRAITRAVQDALCNVRMIPAHGIGGSNKIVEVRVVDTNDRAAWP